MAKKESSKNVSELPDGTLRIRAKDLQVMEKSGSHWKPSKRNLENAINAVEYFIAHGKLDMIKDKKNPHWLKGYLMPSGKTGGARINTLPDERKLDKTFSLFAEDLTIHDSMTNDHWDVLYKNPGGTYSYLYTLEKIEKMKKKKYMAVREFEKIYPKLLRNTRKALDDKNDFMAVPMYTLLKTYMRIGHEIYFKMHGHKGLTTLKKSDIKIKGKHVTFNYHGKDGVPVSITRKFPEIYVKKLAKLRRKKKKDEFIFTRPGSIHPLTENDFKEAFKAYCGKGFYPHIVRSYYATKRAEDFLNNNKQATKKEVRRLFLSIAERLNHKRYSKKKKEWTESWTVTANYYIRPELIEKLRSFEKK